ncbi:MerR family transcriptional regulator [Pseudonocardia alni]|uniref:MerR family transcriptional regulator n=1 Tax=Pseudonocardia alni TaxID=33907 RepID=UPI0033333FBD
MTDEACWSTDDVVRLAGVSSRTLRHYDHIGLVPPAGTGPGGRRLYGRTQLRRLQHVLLLRELGLGLPQIAAVLDTGSDAAEVDALRVHHGRLLDEIARLRRLADTVARSIGEREGRGEMTAEEMFEAFRDDPHGAEARDRWGADAVAVQERVADWTRADATELTADWESVLRRLATARSAGDPVDAPSVQEIVADHHRWVSRFWVPAREAYTGLGELYADDPRFAGQIDAHGAGLSGYLRDAIAVYAAERLEQT